MRDSTGSDALFGPDGTQPPEPLPLLPDALIVPVRHDQQAGDPLPPLPAVPTAQDVQQAIDAAMAEPEPLAPRRPVQRSRAPAPPRPISHPRGPVPRAAHRAPRRRWARLRKRTGCVVALVVLGCVIAIVDALR